METRIELHAKLRIEEMRGLGFLRVSVDLFYHDFEADSEEEVALSRMFRGEVGSRQGTRLGSEDPYDSGAVCVASLDASITRDVCVSDTDELTEAYSDNLLAFDALSATAELLANAPLVANEDLLYHAMSAADDEMIGTIGVVEWMTVHPALQERVAVQMLLAAMGCLTRPNAGLFLVAGLPMDLGSNHRRLAAQGDARRWQVSLDLENSRLRVAPYLDEGSDILILLCGLMSAGTFIEDIEVVASISDQEMAVARDQMREEERQGLR